MTASVDDTATLGENNAENKVSELFVTFVCENCDKTEDEAKLECCEICSRNKDDKGSRTLCQDCGRASHTKKSHNFGDQTRVVRGWSHKKVEIEQEKQKIHQLIGSYYTNKHRQFNGTVMDGIKNMTVSGLTIAKSQLLIGNGYYDTNYGLSLMIGVVEMGCLLYKQQKNEISWQEFGRQCVASTISNIASGYVSEMTLKAGSLVEGPIGTAIRAIGPIILGTGTKYGINIILDKYWPPEHEKRKEITKEKALLQFNISSDIVNDPNKFNRTFLEHRYRELAKMCHPNNYGGSETMYQKLGVNLALLLALLDDEKKVDIEKVLVGIQVPIVKKAVSNSKQDDKQSRGLDFQQDK